MKSALTALRSSKASSSAAAASSLLMDASKSLNLVKFRNSQSEFSRTQRETATHKYRSVSVSFSSPPVFWCESLLLRTCLRVVRGTSFDCVSPMNNRCSMLSDLFVKWRTGFRFTVDRAWTRASQKTKTHLRRKLTRVGRRSGIGRP